MKNRSYLQLLSLFGLLLALIFPGPVFADCKANYDQAMEMLNGELKKANAKTQSDAEAFEMSFKNSVYRLQSEKCLPELMSLIQHIQGEQKKLPRVGKNTQPPPIAD